MGRRGAEVKSQPQSPNPSPTYQASDATETHACRDTRECRASTATIPIAQVTSQTYWYNRIPPDAKSSIPTQRRHARGALPDAAGATCKVPPPKKGPRCPDIATSTIGTIRTNSPFFRATPCLACRSSIGTADRGGIEGRRIPQFPPVFSRAGQSAPETVCLPPRTMPDRKPCAFLPKIQPRKS